MKQRIVERERQMDNTSTSRRNFGSSDTVTFSRSPAIFARNDRHPIFNACFGTRRDGVRVHSATFSGRIVGCNSSWPPTHPSRGESRWFWRNSPRKAKAGRANHLTSLRKRVVEKEASGSNPRTLERRIPFRLWLRSGQSFRFFHGDQANGTERRPRSGTLIEDAITLAFHQIYRRNSCAILLVFRDTFCGYSRKHLTKGGCQIDPWTFS